MPILKLFLIALACILFTGCATQSVYRNGSGNFTEYENYSQWKNKGGITSNFTGQNPSNYRDQFQGGNIPEDLFEKDSSMMVGMRESAAIQRATMRPYKIAGKWYHPSRVDVGDIFDGIASWYGPNFHAKKTSNGETYNMHAHTAASKTLPMNTIVKVTNKENGRITIVRINDRGPFVDGRIIDLSNAAAHDIDMVNKGTANIRLEIIGFGGVIAKSYEKKFQKVAKDDFAKEFKVGDSTESVEGGGFSLQVGAFKNEEGANTTKEQYEQKASDHYQVIVRKEESMFRVFITGFRSEDEAEDYAKKIDLENPIIIRD